METVNESVRDLLGVFVPYLKSLYSTYMNIVFIFLSSVSDVHFLKIFNIKLAFLHSFITFLLKYCVALWALKI